MTTKRSHSEAMQQDPLRDAALQRVRETPLNYHGLEQEYQSDPEICLATLLSCFEVFQDDEEDEDRFSPLLETMHRRAPHFDNHKPVVLMFMDRASYLLEPYFKRYGTRVCEDHDWIKELTAHDKFSQFFFSLPDHLRSGPILLKLVVDNLPAKAFPRFLRRLKLEVLLANEFILAHAFASPEIHLDFTSIPSELWNRKDFVLMWLKKGNRLGTYQIPFKFREDREICRALYKNDGQPSSAYIGGSCVHWISLSLLNDRSFVLECLGWDPKIFGNCSLVLQQDFVVVLEAACGAIRLNSLERFVVDRLGKPFDSFALLVHSHIRAHEELMTFLACLRTSRLNSLAPLSLLNCDVETSKVMTRLIAKYLDFRNAVPIERLQHVWDEVVALMIARCTPANSSLPLVRQNELVKGVLNVIEKERTLVLDNFPDKLWKERLFVEWAAKNGKFHESIAIEFSEDYTICLAYYKHGSAIRERTWAWISDSVKSNKAFVLECASIDPFILGYCFTDDLQYDYQVLLNAVYHAATRGQLEDLVKQAFVCGWTDSLIVFAKSVRAQIEASNVWESFVKATSRYFTPAPATSTTMITQLFGSFLGAVTDEEELGRLQGIWSYHSIFYLALGGKIADLCEANTFLPKKYLTVDAKGDNDESDSDE